MELNAVSYVCMGFALGMVFVAGLCGASMFLIQREAKKIEKEMEQ